MTVDTAQKIAPGSDRRYYQRRNKEILFSPVKQSVIFNAYYTKVDNLPCHGNVLGNERVIRRIGTQLRQYKLINVQFFQRN